MSDVTEEYVCPADHKHAENHTCYTCHGFRCPDCRAHEAAAAKFRYREQAYGRWKPFLVDSMGTRRRIQALQAIGWSQPKIAALLGVRVRSWPWMASPHLLVERATRDRVAALYEQLWNQPAPRDTPHNRQSDTRSRNLAAARGWLPPAAWDDIDTDPEPPAVDRDLDYVDDAAVELAIAGVQVPLTVADRCAAVTILNRRHLNDHEIAALLHLDPRSVLRIRARLQLPAAVGADRQPIYDTSRRDAA